MLHCILICPDQLLNSELAIAIADLPDVELVRVFPSYPSLEDLLRTIRVRKPDFLLLSTDGFSEAENLASQLDDVMPGFPVVAVARSLEPNVLSKLMHLGVRECLTSPINRATLAETVNSIQRRLKTHPFQTARLADLYTFLPAKPGVGCSTIATSVSCAVAEEFGVRTLLLDCDLAAGATKFLLKLGNSASIVDALEHALNLDEDLWAQTVGKWGKLDVLHAGELNPPPSIDLSNLQRVLSFARAQYDVICADLGSSLDPFSINFMRESRRIFVVTTPEIVPIHFAAERVKSLEKLGLADRVRLLVNRKTGRRGTFGDEELARLVGLPVIFSFSNDYFGVEKSILDGSPVSRGSSLGQSVLNLAQSLAPHVELKETSKHRKFLEFFHVPHNVEESVDVYQD